MINQEINEKLLKEVRLFFGILIFKKDSLETVPEELTHDYLLANFDIPQIIKEYYFSPCRDMLTDEDYQNFVSGGYVGNAKTTLSPYPFMYNGAFLVRKKLYYQLRSLTYSKNKYKGKPIEKFKDLFPYFEEYSLGFKEGFDSFEDNCIKKFLPMFAEKSDYINKLFEYITKEIFIKHSWRNNHNSFKISMSSSMDFKDGGEITDAFEDGRFQGYFYKAWSLLFSNSKLFENLFIEHINLKTKLVENNIVHDVLNAAHTMQQNKIYWTLDEDSRTRQVLDLLHKNYHTKDQSKYGKSTVGKQAGSVDGVIYRNNKEYFLEAFNLSSLRRATIKTHINKLEKNYDSKGIKEKFILVYYNLKTNTFQKAAEKYSNYITSEHNFVYPRINEIEEVNIEYTDSRLFKTYHNREGKKVVLYHLLLMFPT